MFGLPDIVGNLLRSYGLEPEQMVEQAQRAGQLLDYLGAALHRIEAGVVQLQTNQIAIMTEMGLHVPEPTGEQLALIEDETAAYLARHGGPAPPPAEAAA